MYKYSSNRRKDGILNRKVVKGMRKEIRVSFFQCIKERFRCKRWNHKINYERLEILGPGSKRLYGQIRGWRVLKFRK